MKVILKNRLVNDQILATVGAEVSALLNTRPLTYLSVDPVDPDPLTPNHFLHAGARPYTPLRFVDIASTSAPEKQFKYSQEVVEHFWWRWPMDYIPPLTCRRKWHGESESVAVGNIVIVANDFNPRGQWPLALVELSGWCG